LQQRLVKTGGRFIKHARYYSFLLAEGHGAAVAGGIKRVHSGADFDDDAGAEGEVSAESIGETAF
jgi:hypothetical protein